jgi:hypothetical protein
MWDGAFRNVRICHGDKRAGNSIIQSGLPFWGNLNAEFRYGRLTFQSGATARRHGGTIFRRGTFRFQNGNLAIASGSATSRHGEAALRNGAKTVSDGSTMIARGVDVLKNGSAALRNGSAANANGTASNWIGVIGAQLDTVLVAQAVHGCGFRRRLAARAGGLLDSRGETPPEPAGEDARATFLPGDDKNSVKLRRSHCPTNGAFCPSFRLLAPNP